MPIRKRSAATPAVSLAVMQTRRALLGPPQSRSNCARTNRTLALKCQSVHARPPQRPYARERRRGQTGVARNPRDLQEPMREGKVICVIKLRCVDKKGTSASQPQRRRETHTRTHRFDLGSNGSPHREKKNHMTRAGEATRYERKKIRRNSSWEQEMNTGEGRGA